MAPITSIRDAALLVLSGAYALASYGLSKVEVQKLVYFLQEAGEDLRLPFVKHQFGPYADNLRHALDRMDGHYIHGVGDSVVDSAITPSEAALVEAKRFIDSSGGQLKQRVERVERLIDGFQSPFGMELLASVHWVCKHEGATTNKEALEKVQGWNDRKQQIMKPHHVESAWNQLHKQAWV